MVNVLFSGPSLLLVLPCYILCNIHACTLKFQIISGIETQADYTGMDYVLVDFPGSTEMFTWNSSNNFITEAFASKFATVVAYVVNTPRSQSAKTFLSTMLDACSILYKTRLPLILAFNKTDLTQHHFALEVYESLNVCFYCRLCNL